MAVNVNAIYPKGREKFLTGQVDWLTDDIVVIGVDSTYAYSAAHEFVDDLTGIVFTSDPVTGKDATDGIADCDDLTVVSVSGNDVEALIFAADSGVDATSPVICVLGRTATSVLITVTPDGGNILINWPNGATKIFRL